jgi:hypothetical protein
MTSRSFRLAHQLVRFVGEAAWLLAWSAVLGHWLDPEVGPALPLPALAAYLLSSSVLGRAVSRIATGSPLVDVAVSTLGLVASVGGGMLLAGTLDRDTLLRTVAGTRAVFAAGVALVAWWRGTRLGVNRATLHEVEGQFRFGIVALSLLLALVASLGPSAAPPPMTLVPIALAFVASGLVAIPLARIAEVSAGPRAEAPRLTPTGPWIATLLGVVAGLLILTLLLAGVFTAERVGALVGLVLGAISRVLWVVVMLVALPAGYLVEWLMGLLQGALSGEPAERPIQQMPPFEDLLRDAEGRRGQMSPELELLMVVVLALGIAAFVVALLSRALVRRRDWQSESDGVEEIRESVFGWEVVREVIAQVWEWLLRRRRSATAEDPSASTADEVVPRSIREVYREFLRLTGRLGFGRGRAETPIEYARRLVRDHLGEGEAASPVGRDALDTLTGSYVETRYGPPPVEPTDPGPAARALERLRSLWTRGEET